MFVIGNNAIGKGGFVPAANKGYLLTATGEPPITLTKTLKREPESIVVTGASGGVGDWDTTKNIFGTYVYRDLSGATITSFTDNELRFTTTRGGTCYVHLFYPVIAGQTYTLYGNASRCNISLYRNSQSNAHLIAQAIDISSGYEYTADFTGNLLVRVYSPSGSTAGRDCAVTNAGLYGCYRIPILLQGRNLFDKNTVEWTEGYFIAADGSITQNTYASFKSAYTSEIQLSSNTTYTVGIILPSKQTGGGMTYFRVHLYDNSGQWVQEIANTVNVGSDKVLTFTTTNNFKIRLSCTYSISKDKVPAEELMIVKGAYTLEDFPPYYPYIPNKTINLYSDVALGADESLTVNPKTHEATKHDDTSVARLQDWSQDFKIPKADSVTVTADTTVAPSNIEIRYLSRAKTAESGTSALPREVTDDEEPILYDDAKTDSLDEAEPNDPDPYPLIER